MRRASLVSALNHLLQPHPDRRLQSHWHWVQIGVVILPFSPLLGGISIILTSVLLWGTDHKTLLQRPMTWGLALLSVLMIGTACLGVDWRNALLGTYNFLPLFITFSALSALIQTPEQLRRLSWLLVLNSVPVVAIGFGQQFLGWAGHPKILWLVMDLVIAKGGNPIGRMASVFDYANFLASYLSLVLILGLGLWIEALPSALKPRHRSSAADAPKISPPFHFIGLTTVLLGMAGAIVLTSSRNAWVITFLAGLAFALYQRWYWLTAATTAAATALFGAAFAPSPAREGLRFVIPRFFWARVSDELYPDRPIADLRQTQWHFAWAMTQQRPWTGWGLRSFTSLYQAQMHVWLGHPHNLFLMLTAETGIPATVLLISLVGWIMAQGSRLLLVSAVAPTALNQPDRLILFSYLLAFAACTLAATVDVTLFDFRINLLGWMLLSGICGIVYYRR